MTTYFCETCEGMLSDYQEWRKGDRLIIEAICLDCNNKVKVIDKVLTQHEISRYERKKKTENFDPNHRKNKKERGRNRHSVTTVNEIKVKTYPFEIGYIYETQNSLFEALNRKEKIGLKIGELEIPLNAISKDELINSSISKLISLSQKQSSGNGSLTQKEKQKLISIAQKFLFASDFNFLLSLPSLGFKPYDFQITAPKKILSEMNGRGILADEVGLGKTLQAGIVIKELLLREIITSCLILVPTSLKNQWEEEMYEKFNIQFEVADSTKELKRMLKSSNLIIASLYLFSRNNDEIYDVKTDMLIIDESHRLRNKGTKLYKAITLIESKYKLLLTATPFQNNLSELYNLVNILRPGALGTWSYFNNSFIKNNIKDSPYYLEVLKGIVRKYIIRRRRKSLKLNIPRRTAKTIRLRSNELEKKLYDITGEYIVELTTHDNSNLRGIKGLLMCSMLRRATSSPKAISISYDNALSNLSKRRMSVENETNIKEILYQGIDIADAIIEKSNITKLNAVFRELNLNEDQLIIFSEFHDTTKWLSDELQLQGYDVTHFHGGLKSSSRSNLIKQFTDQKSRIFVSTDAGSEGLNLQAAHKVMNFDLPWNPMRIEQRIGRVHRLTQTENVEVINLALDGSIEQRVLDKILYKIGLFEDVIGGLDEIVGQITNTNYDKSGDALQYLILQNYVKSINNNNTWDDFDSSLEAIGNQSINIKEEINVNSENINIIFEDI